MTISHEIKEKVLARLEKLKKWSVPFPQNVDEFSQYCEELNKIKPAMYLEIGSRHGGSLYVASGFLQKHSDYAGIKFINFGTLVNNIVRGINNLLTVVFFLLPYGLLAWLIYYGFGWWNKRRKK